MIEGTCGELDGLPHELVLGNYVCPTIDESRREQLGVNEREDDGEDDFTPPGELRELKRKRKKGQDCEMRPAKQNRSLKRRPTK